VSAGRLDLPDAIRMNESFVDVSPSIVMQLNERSATCFAS
jgi:hypothetical protein